MKLLFLFFLAAFVAANLIVKHFGAYGLWFSSALLIPFDFVARCVIHERYKGWRLIAVLFSLTFAAALITVAFNWNAKNVALGSVAGFSAAQLGAGIFYQYAKRKNKGYMFKVNISDLVAIVLDSIVFQIIAFGVFNPTIAGGQILIKFIGGLLWYWILFEAIKIRPAGIILDEHEKQIA